MANLIELRNLAIDLGIKVDGRWKKKRLLYEIEMANGNAGRLDCVPSNDSEKETAKEAQEKSFKIKNMSANKFVCGFFECDSKEIVTVKGERLEDAKLIKVLTRQIEIGKFKLMG